MRHAGRTTARRLVATALALALAVAVAAYVHAHRDVGPARPRPRPPTVIVIPEPAIPPSTPGPLAASRAFVDAYAGFIYGRTPASGLPHASPYVRAQLASQRPRPPAVVVAAADPRLRSLRLEPETRTAARAVAVIADGAAAYQLHLALERRRGQWTITGISEAG